MSYSLTIDIGNTLHKIGLFNNEGEICQVFNYQKLTNDILSEIFDKYVIDKVIFCAVGSYQHTLIHYLEQHAKLLVFNHKTPIPINLQYRTCQTLGLDRIANAVGAYSLFPKQAVLAIQVGSCIVFDFIDNQANYLGGSISPGIEMRFKALHFFTRNLPLLTKSDVNGIIGNTTQQAITIGVMEGVKNEINGFINQYNHQFGDLKIVMTGGDLSCLQNSINYTIFAASNLVLIGLHKILKFND